MIYRKYLCRIIVFGEFLRIRVCPNCQKWWLHHEDGMAHGDMMAHGDGVAHGRYCESWEGVG